MMVDGNPSVLNFRNWYKDLAKYIEKRDGWRGTGVLFKVIRGYPNQIMYRETVDLQTVATNRDRGPQRGDPEFGKGPPRGNVDFGTWNMHDTNKEIFDCVEYALAGKCSESVANVLTGDGFKLLRKLARKYDPISPQAVSIYKAKVFSYAG